MKLIKTIHEDYFKMKFIIDYYDIPLDAIGYYKNKIYYFKVANFDDDYGHIYYNMYSLSFIEKIRYNFMQWNFERVYGYHNSF